jgi:hypothetical protein
MKSFLGPEPPVTFEELESFCRAHGVRVPRPRTYRSLRAAMRAVVAHEVAIAVTEDTPPSHYGGQGLAARLPPFP